EEGCTLHAHIFAAVHRLLDPGPESIGDSSVLIRNERNCEAVFADKLLMLLHRIARDTDHLDTRLGIIAREPGEVLRLAGAARCVVLGIEIENQRLAGRGEVDATAICCSHSDSGCAVALVDHLMPL